MTEITIEVLRRTVEELTGRVTPDNRRAVLMIIDSYNETYHTTEAAHRRIDRKYMQLQIDALNWEKEYVKARLVKVKGDAERRQGSARSGNRSMRAPARPDHELSAPYRNGT